MCSVSERQSSVLYQPQGVYLLYPTFRHIFIFVRRKAEPEIMDATRNFGLDMKRRFMGGGLQLVRL